MITVFILINTPSLINTAFHFLWGNRWPNTIKIGFRLSKCLIFAKFFVPGMPCKGFRIAMTPGHLLEWLWLLFGILNQTAKIELWKVLLMF